MSVSCNIIIKQKAEISSPDQGGVYKWCTKIGFLPSKHFHFTSDHHTLSNVNKIHQCISICHPNYTTDDAGAKPAVIKTFGNEKMQVTVMLTELADSMKLPPCDTELGGVGGRGLRFSALGVSIMSKGWMTKRTNGGSYLLYLLWPSHSLA
jgi:hypothetical protein